MSEIIETKPRDRRLSEGSDVDYDDPQFKPIVCLPEVEVSTNEEDEEVLLKMRAKLYRFDTSCEPSEWKERGTGEVKILQHKENYSVRIVMRRDKTFRVCANHFLTPWMVLKVCSGNERAFIYTVAADFADEKPKSECLAIKFASAENANVFKRTFEEAKAVLLNKCSLYNGKCDEEEDVESEEGKETTEITEKLSELDVSTKKEESDGEAEKEV